MNQSRLALVFLLTIRMFSFNLCIDVTVRCQNQPIAYALEQSAQLGTHSLVLFSIALRI